MTSRKVIIGIDGVPFSLLDELAEQGVMPCLRSLAGEGVFRPMLSSLPAVSAVSWSSIITGCNPGEHGIYGFTQMMPDTYTIAYPNYLSLKRPAFWQDEIEPCVIINVPFTYPAQQLNGCHIAGFVAPKIEKAVYPYSELTAIEGMGYRIDVDAAMAQQSDLALYNQLFETHARREEVADYLWGKYDPAVFMPVFTGSDRLGHFGWRHWEQQDHPDHDKFLEYFRRVDKTIERIAVRLDADDTLIVISDHGMEAAAHEVNLNAYLIEAGFLRLDDNESRKYDRIQEGSVAFALEDGRVHLNERGRYPRGSVEPGEQEALVAQLTEFLGQLQVNGEKIAGQVHRRDDIYHGENASVAPHLVVEPNPSFKLVGRLTTDLHQPSRLAGMHNEQAFILVKGPEAEQFVPEVPTVEDVVSILENCAGGKP